MGPLDRRAHDLRVLALTSQPPPLPNFSAFHRRFRDEPDGNTPEGNLRDAFFLSYNEQMCEYLTGEEAQARLDEGRDVVSATFVTPYPPGFPILVPGQIISRDILEFMQALDTREIHGYLTGLGYRVFTKRRWPKGAVRVISHSGAGVGFAIPLIIRYVLEVAQPVAKTVT
jgi:arginine decarboxylase